MLPNCKQVAEQLSENIDQPLTGFKLFKFKLHLMMCSVCRLYGKHIHLSAQTIEAMHQHKLPSETLKKEVLAQYQQFQQQRNNPRDNPDQQNTAR
jgi:predicted anti-sigma-YlaC factor YlaD